MAQDEKRISNGLMFKLLEVAIYIGFIILGFYLAFLFRFDMNPAYNNIGPYYDSIPYIVISAILIFRFYDIASTNKKSIFENGVIIAISLVLINLLTIAIVFFNRGFAFPRSIFVLSFFIQFTLIFTTKYIILKALKLHIKSLDVLILGSDEEAQYLATKMLQDEFNRDNIKHICNRVNKNTYKLINNVDKIYIGNKINTNDKNDLIRYCSERGKTVYLVPGLLEISLVDFKTTQISDVLLFKIDHIGLSFEERLVKRLSDLVMAIVGIVITSPIMLVTAIVISVYDHGPVFLKQERVTRNNRNFNLYKFRTMIVNAEQHSGPVLATDKDPRITPLGGFLRATRIDELPQLFNVLMGDMSMVGPRPERPFFVEQFNEEIDEFKYRVFVKAGITGLAQVLGRYTTNAEDKAKYDLLYIKNYSIILDLKIILNTIKIVFLKESAAGIIEDKKIDKMLKDLNFNIHKNVTYHEDSLTPLERRAL